MRLLRLVLILSLTTVLGLTVLAGEEAERTVLFLPEGMPEKDTPLLVGLHEVAMTAEDAAREWRALAEAGGFALLCPSAAGERFTDTDLPGVLAAIEEASAPLDIGTVHLAGRRDAGLAATRFALSRPRVFRSVVAEGTEVPELRPEPGADRLRLLLLKGAGDRAEAGRESVVRIREGLEVAEFRLLAGEGRDIDPATLLYTAHFIAAASGRMVAGRDLSLSWVDPVRGLALQKARKSPALIYLFDPAPAFRSRTDLIQGEILFDAELREAMGGVVPVLAARSAAEEVVPGARLAPGPAIVVLDREGKAAGVLQKNLSARAILILLRR